MPRLCDMQAAIPLCHRRLMVSESGQQRESQHGWHRFCFKPMRYLVGRNSWKCECGAEEAGELVAARRLARIIEAEAA